MIDILEEPICHGIIAVEVEGKERDFDARPSDAISLALRARVPIYVSPAVVNKGAVVFNRKIGRRVWRKKPSFRTEISPQRAQRAQRFIRQKIKNSKMIIIENSMILAIHEF